MFVSVGTSWTCYKTRYMKALVWFWIIDETLELTSILSVCRLNEVGTCQVMEASDDHGDDGDDHKMIKCST